MRRVEQTDENGCGVACIAMLAGLTYGETKRKMARRWYQDGMDVAEIKKALRKVGLSPAKRLFRVQHYRKLQTDAILRVKLPKQFNGAWHWIVWDANRRRFLDPHWEPYKKPRVLSFLRVSRGSKR